MYSNVSNSKDVATFIRKRKSDLRKIFHSKCCLCGFDEVQEALEFHHVNLEEKSFQICNSRTKSLKKQLEELKKTILVCSNCHRGIHNNIYKVPDNWKDFYDYEVEKQLLEKLENATKHKIYYCRRCGKEIKNNTKYCIECGHIVQQKCNRPSREELKEMIRNLPFTTIAKKYEISDNAIRKWCKKYGLPNNKKVINNITNEDWEKI